jgi:carbonic anhydrase
MSSKVPRRPSSAQNKADASLFRRGLDNKLLVIGIPFELNLSNKTALVSTLGRSVKSIATQGSVITLGPLDYTEVVQHVTKSSKIQYSGSLTTPPCTEGVTWVVVTNPMPLDVDSYKEIKDVVKFNARYIQSSLGKENVLEQACKSG